MPDQEIYLAALDQQSAEAIAELAQLMDEGELFAQALAQAGLIRNRLNDYRQQDGFYAFSKFTNGSYDSSATIFPSVAWWTGRPNPAECLMPCFRGGPRMSLRRTGAFAVSASKVLCLIP